MGTSGDNFQYDLGQLKLIATINISNRDILPDDEDSVALWTGWDACYSVFPQIKTQDCFYHIYSLAYFVDQLVIGNEIKTKRIPEKWIVELKEHIAKKKLELDQLGSGVQKQERE